MTQTTFGFTSGAVLFYKSDRGFSSGLGRYCHCSWALSRDHEHPLPFTLATVAGSTGHPYPYRTPAGPTICGFDTTRPRSQHVHTHLPQQSLGSAARGGGGESFNQSKEVRPTRCRVAPTQASPLGGFSLNDLAYDLPTHLFVAPDWPDTHVQTHCMSV